MVRKKGPVWEHFNSGSRNDSHPHVQCKYCLKDFKRAIPERMQAHLDKKCPNAPSNAKSQSIIDNEEIVSKKGPIWENFHIIGKHEDSHPHIQCKYCSKDFKRAIPKRMQAHL